MRNCEPTPRGPERGGAGNPPLPVRASHFYPTPELQRQSAQFRIVSPELCTREEPGTRSRFPTFDLRIGSWVAADKAIVLRVEVPPCQLPDSGT